MLKNLLMASTFFGLLRRLFIFTLTMHEERKESLVFYASFIEHLCKTNVVNSRDGESRRRSSS
jgi:hypothetical protein